MVSRNLIFFPNLVALSIIGEIVAGTYLPMLPVIETELTSSNFSITDTLVTYLIAFGCSQLAFGYIYQAFGEKVSFIIGLLILQLGSALCLVSQSVELLSLARALQGMGCGACLITARATVGRSISKDRLPAAMSTMMIFFAGAMICAPALGGVMNDRQAVFFLHFSIATLMAVVTLIQCSSNAPIGQVTLLDYCDSFREVLQNRQFLYCLTSLALGVSALHVFNAGFPSFAIGRLELSPRASGFAISAVFAGFVFGLFVSRFSLRYLSVRTLLRLGMLVLLLSVPGIYASYHFESGIYYFLVAQISFAFGAGLVSPSLNARMLSMFPYKTGVASVCIGVFPVLLAATTVIAASALEAAYPSIFILVECACLVLSVLSFGGIKNLD